MSITLHHTPSGGLVLRQTVAKLLKSAAIQAALNKNARFSTIRAAPLS